MKHKVLSWLDEFYYLVALQFVLIFITGLDYIVHSILYEYGLQFSYNWANPYWVLLLAIFFSVSGVGALAYKIDRKKVSKLKIFAVFITLLAEQVAGFLDSLWFLIQYLHRGSVDWAVNWWWSPYSWILGHWDLRMNVTLNVVVAILLIVMWVYIEGD